MLKVIRASSAIQFAPQKTSAGLRSSRYARAQSAGQLNEGSKARMLYYTMTDASDMGLIHSAVRVRALTSESFSHCSKKAVPLSE